MLSRLPSNIPVFLASGTDGRMGYHARKKAIRKAWGGEDPVVPSAYVFLPTRDRGLAHVLLWTGSKYRCVTEEYSKPSKAKKSAILFRQISPAALRRLLPN